MPHAPCSRTCTSQVPLTSLAPGPVHPRYPSHPLPRDLSTSGTPHIPCSRTCTAPVPRTCAPHVHFTSLDREHVHPIYSSHPLLQDLCTLCIPHIHCSRTCTFPAPCISLAPLDLCTLWPFRSTPRSKLNWTWFLTNASDLTFLPKVGRANLQYFHGPLMRLKSVTKNGNLSCQWSLFKRN